MKRPLTLILNLHVFVRPFWVLIGILKSRMWSKSMTMHINPSMADYTQTVTTKGLKGVQSLYLKIAGLHRQLEMGKV